MSRINIAILLLGALTGAALAPLGSTSIAVAIPIISQSVNEDPATVARLLVGAYLFISIAGQVPGGKATDFWGTTRTLYLGLTIVVAGALLGFLVPDIAALTLSRMIMALGTALIGPATQSLIRQRLSGSLLGFAFGVFGTTMTAAAALGPWIGGLIIHTAQWQWIFAVNIPFALTSALLIAVAVRQLPTSSPSLRSRDISSVDFPGVILLAATVLSIQVALGDRHGTASAFILMLGAGFLFLLYRQERAHANPIIPLHLFSNKGYSSCCGIIALNNLIMYSLLFQTPLLLTDVWHLGPLTSGTYLLSMTLAMMATGIVSGLLVTRIGPRPTLLIAQAMIGVGLYLLHLSITDANSAMLIRALVALGIGVGMTMPVVQSVALASNSRQLSGVASGTLNTSRYLGGAVGIAVMTRILATDGPNVSAHQQILWLYAAALAIVVLLCSFIPRKLDVVD